MNKIFLFSGLFILALNVKTRAQVGTNDPTFNSGTGANSSIGTAAVQPDGKIVIGGTFTSYNGTSKNRIIRTNTDGSVDGTFTPGTAANNSVYKVGILSSGKILGAGQFTSYNAHATNRIVRINTDGTYDNTFTVGAGADGYVYTFAEQTSDSKIIISGNFTHYAGVARNRVARVNANGTIDATFNPGTGANKAIYSIAIQNDSKILLGGTFTTFNSLSNLRLIRLNANGSIDASFLTGTGITGTTTNTAVYSIAVQNDGKILVGGLFSTYNGTSCNNLIRLNTDGTFDPTFSSGTGTNAYVRSIEIQPTGKIIIVGAFTTYNGVAKARIVRLNTDGSIDNTFGGTGANSSILCSAMQTDGNMIIGGDFTAYSGTSRTRLARVNSACPTLTLSLLGQTNNICNNGAAGSASVAATGGSVFSFTWLPTGGNTSIANNLEAGTYTCIAGNECFNTSTLSITITQPDPVSLVTLPSSTVCSGGTASLSANAIGGTGAYTYTWLPGNLTGSTQTITPTSSTIFTVTATDINGCVGSSIQNIEINPLPTITISGGNTPICSGSTATLTASGANTYSWTTGDNTAQTFVSPASSTSYSVTGTDVNGCTNISAKTITVTGICATSSVPCGIIINNLGNTASAVNIAGAINYRFKFYNNITNTLVATLTQASRTLTFSAVSGIHYGNTYKWTVAVDKGTGFGPESNPNCTVIIATPSPIVTCGISYSNINSYSAGTGIYGASNYRFKFYNAATNALIATKTQTSNYIYFNQVPGLAYGNTYNWTVEAEYNNGVSLLYSAPSSSNCTITFNPPQSTVPCGNTYAKTAYASVPAVSGATGFRYNFYDVTTNALVATTTNTNQYIYFNQVPGLILNKSYNWTVEVRYNNGSGNVFGPPSASPCIMNYGTPSSFVTNGGNVITEENSAARIAQQLSVNDNNELFWVTLYPNPAKDNVRIEASEMIQQVKIYNMAGELVLSPENTDEITIKDLKAGVYIVTVQTGMGLKHMRLIKE
jgi:uncharacterized delta-60 repeat protein